MKCTRLKCMLFAGLLVCLSMHAVSAVTPAHAGAPAAGGLFEAWSPIQAQSTWDIWVRLPVYSAGFAVIPEGFVDYPLKTRILRSYFPLDLDLTLLVIWGYTGDKVTLTIADLGDPGDTLGALALAYEGGVTTPYWGNVYSENTGDAIRIIIPHSNPDVYVRYILLASWYWSPSLGDDPYTYEISVSYPQ